MITSCGDTLAAWLGVLFTIVSIAIGVAALYISIRANRGVKEIQTGNNSSPLVTGDQIDRTVAKVRWTLDRESRNHYRLTNISGTNALVTSIRQVDGRDVEYVGFRPTEVPAGESIMIEVHRLGLASPTTVATNITWSENYERYGSIVVYL